MSEPKSIINLYRSLEMNNKQIIVNIDIENVPKCLNLTPLTNKLYKIKPKPRKKPTDAETKSKPNAKDHILIVNQNI